MFHTKIMIHHIAAILFSIEETGTQYNDMIL